jgi:hypothetical protein
VNAVHEVRVDQSPILPQILGAGFDEGGERVEVTRYFQNSRSNGREDFLDVLNDPVIECVNGAVGGRFANAANHERLDVLSLDLDVNPRALTNRVEHIIEGRDSNAVREDDLSQLGRREIGDRRARQPMEASDCRVVVYHHHTVARGMNIQLYRISAQLQCLLERGDRVLGKTVMRAPVRYALGDLEHGALGQAGLGGGNFGYDDREAMKPALRGQPSLTEGVPERLLDEAP